LLPVKISAFPGARPLHFAMLDKLHNDNPCASISWLRRLQMF
jgi:hypothetical protein